MKHKNSQYSISALGNQLLQSEEDGEEEDEDDAGGFGHGVETDGDVLEGPVRQADVQRRRDPRRR